MNNKLKANAALAVSAIGAAITVPSLSPIAPVTTTLGNFTLGLFNHAFLAATIGGLADWFAVTALFRKPLGISFRTQILIRNRKRIMDAIVEFVSNDLLNTRNIMNTVREENTALLLIEYFNHNDGRRKIKNIIFELLVELAAGANTQKLAQSVSPLIQKEISAIDPNQIVKFFINVLTKKNHSKKILAFLCDAAQNIFHAHHIQHAILQKIAVLLRDYEGSNAGRAFLLSAINFNEERVLSILNENVDDKIKATVRALEGSNVEPNTVKNVNELVETFNNFVRTVADDSSTRNFIGDVKSFFTDNVNVAEYIQLWLDRNLKGQSYVEAVNKTGRAEQLLPVELNKNDLHWRAAVEKLVDDKIDGFINSPMQQDTFDRFVKKSIESILNDYHDTIPDLINERLNRLDDQQLTEFVESRVADDLQMIRINGAVCGACVGVGLYLLKF